MRILLMILCGLLVKTACCQDSVAAVYVRDLIQKAEARLATDIAEKKDTTIFDEGDSLKRGAFMRVRTEFFTDPQTMMLDKIVEKSVYKNITTELTVYFFGNQPICFTTRQWDGNSIHIDFDIYYMNDKLVFTVKRRGVTGNPDGSLFLKWCYDLRTDYFRIVQEYNQTFARNKVKLR